ncbi:hypothetical protein GIW45_23885 [Pseudomonas congelans]|uniref:hypothetical protein n=1 Tax=Pseudomonas congelans TaxID=200452 RepID=UPI001F345B9F|nr:hypothetical protein [Pseudomonas congelans]MCF5167024.1 hypothetical protein [Pseudomonas congelans]
MRSKLIGLTISAFLFSVGVSFYTFVDGLSQRSPDEIHLSVTRQYILEKVYLRLFFVDCDLAFVRVTDLNEPRKIYRSPLFFGGEFDVKELFISGRLGTSFLEFSAEKKSFIFHSKQLRDSWLNRFVANTPYSVESTVRGGE